MKRIWYLSLSILILGSCKEKGPAIDFGIKAADTSYLTTVETPQSRVVLIEEFTGVTCSNCPAGHVILAAIDSAHPNNVAIMGIQIIGNPQTEPLNNPSLTPVKTNNDNRTQVGTDLSNSIYLNVGSIPSGGVDRVPVAGSLLLGRNDWPNAVNNRLTVAPPANITLTKTYDSVAKKVSLKVHVAYTSAVTVHQNLTVALIENNVIDAQEFSPTDPIPFVQNYVHKHVLRDIITPAAGTAILGTMSTIPAGEVYERTFDYTLPNNVLVPANCAFIAFVSNNDGDNKEVNQAAEVNLK